MSAKLYSDNSSSIIEMVNDNKEQSLLNDGYTEWIWRIKPINSKENYIKLIITISDRDLVVYEKTIPVNGNIWYSIKTWLSNWWEIVASTLILPIIIPLIIYFKRKKSKKG